MKKHIIASLLIGATILPALQGCVTVVAAGVTAGAMAAFDRRTVGTQTEDESIEWKASAQVSEKHAGFVINRGGATCADVLALVDQVRERVLRETGVTLEREVRLLG